MLFELTYALLTPNREPLLKLIYELKKADNIFNSFSYGPIFIQLKVHTLYERLIF